MKTILIDIDDRDYEALITALKSGRTMVGDHIRTVGVRVLRCAFNEAGESAYTLDGDEDRETKIKACLMKFAEEHDSYSPYIWLENCNLEHEHWLRTRTDAELDEAMHDLANEDDEDA